MELIFIQNSFDPKEILGPITQFIELGNDSVARQLLIEFGITDSEQISNIIETIREALRRQEEPLQCITYGNQHQSS